MKREERRGRLLAFKEVNGEPRESSGSKTKTKVLRSTAECQKGAKNLNLNPLWLQAKRGKFF